ncbi:NAD(P)-dependent oxidoreductase [Persicitalea sp.]|uniref:NAD(P)-dependent oxidoreductase n=1 Tax=Persicitalea sp. TaxID=3100273 RepID=UPI003593E9D3
MNQKAKIAVIGGTGKAGKYLVKELLRQDFPLKLLLRNPGDFSFENPDIEVIQGDARDYETVRTLKEGCGAVVSAVGFRAGKEPIFSIATGNVLRAMQEWNITRYISLTGLNVDTPFDQKTGATQAGTEYMRANYPKTTADKQVEYQKLTESDAAWVLVRLPWIQLTEAEEDVKVSLEDCPGEAVSASALARFVVAQLTNDTYVRQAPFVAN